MGIRSLKSASISTGAKRSKFWDQSSVFMIGVAGYLAGGIGSSNSNQTSIFKYAFGTDTTSTISASVGTGRYQTGGLSNYALAGYFLNGYVAGGGESGVSEKFTFTSETVSSLTGTTPHAESANVTNSGSWGYQLGGYNGGNLNTSLKFQYSTEVASNATNIAYTDRGMGGVNNKGSKAYYGGGTNTGNTQYYSWSFSTEASSALSGQYVGGGTYLYISGTASNEGTAGYINNRANTPAGYLQKLTFSTETVSSLSAQLRQGASNACTNIGSYGLFTNDSNAVNGNTDKLNYSTQTVSAGTAFSTYKNETFYVSNNNY